MSGFTPETNKKRTKYHKYCVTMRAHESSVSSFSFLTAIDAIFKE